MSTTMLKMAKMSDKMKQDGGKMRKMKAVSSVLGPPGRQGPVWAANSEARRGHGEVPPQGG